MRAFFIDGAMAALTGRTASDGALMPAGLVAAGEVGPGYPPGERVVSLKGVHQLMILRDAGVAAADGVY